MSDIKSFTRTVSRINEVLSAIAIAKSAPANAQAALKGAIIGHNDWKGYGLREIQNTDGLHSRAVAAVTDYLVNDLAERKRLELRALADELDTLRSALVAESSELRFTLLDDVLSARTWQPATLQSTGGEG